MLLADGGGPQERGRRLRHEVAHVVQHLGGGPGLSDLRGTVTAQGDGGLDAADLAAIGTWLDGTGGPPVGGVGSHPAPPAWSPTGLDGTAFGPFRSVRTGGALTDVDPYAALAGDVCPSCHQTREELLRARRDRLARADRERRVRERHTRWEGSHEDTHATFLEGPATSLADDIAASRDQLVVQRMALLRAAAARSAPDPFAALLDVAGPRGGTLTGTAPRPAFPADLADAWRGAHQERSVVAALLRDRLLTPEGAAVARARYQDFYRLLLPVVEQEDARLAAWAQESQRLADALRPPPNPCPSCHSETPPPARTFRAPPARAPDVRRWFEAVGRATPTEGWGTVGGDFERATGLLDDLALGRVPRDDTAAEGFTSARDLLARQEQLARDHPDAIRVRAVFYPKDAWVQPDPPHGPRVEIAQGIPWFFYLTSTHTTIREGFPDLVTWTLRDVTSPGRPHVSVSSSVFDVVAGVEQRGDRPPRELFEELDDALVFPEGVLYWRYPDGRTDGLRTTEPWSLSDWLGAIGIGLTALGVILMTGGLATPAVLTGLGIAAAGFGVASTLADLRHRSELGILTDADTRRAILFLAADIVSALTLGVGRAAALAGEAAVAAGRVTSVAVRLRRAAAVADLADRALGASVLVTMTADYVDQYRAIMSSGLPAAERDAALEELTRSALFTGAIVLGPHAVSHVVGGGRRGAGGSRPGTPEAPVVRGPEAAHPHPEAGFLHESAAREVLPAPDAARELQVARQVGHETAVTGDPEVVRRIEIGGHRWEEQAGGRGWCRFSTRRCYSAAELAVGVGGRGERTTAGTVDDVARRRAELRRRPSRLRSDADRLDWADYVFYAERRLAAVEEALAAGRTPPTPPRTFESFRTEHPLGSVVRNEIRGTGFERRSREALVEALGPERAELVLAQHHLSEVLKPTVGEGMLTRPDSLIPDPGGTWTAVSNKSRSSFAGMRGDAVEVQVVADLLEAVDKYSGTRHVRRTGGTVEVTRVWLLYDAAALPERHHATVRRVVADFDRVHRSSGLTFEVGIF